MGGAPSHKNNLIGTAARGWTQIEPLKVDNKVFSFRFHLTHLLLAKLLKPRRLQWSPGKRSPPLPTGWLPEEPNSSSLKNFNIWSRRTLNISIVSSSHNETRQTANHKRVCPVTSSYDVSCRRFPGNTWKHAETCGNGKICDILT